MELSRFLTYVWQAVICASQMLKSFHKWPIWHGCFCQHCSGWVKHRRCQHKLPYRQSFWRGMRAVWDFLKTKMIVQSYSCAASLWCLKAPDITYTCITAGLCLCHKTSLQNTPNCSGMWYTRESHMHKDIPDTSPPVRHIVQAHGNYAA